MLAVMLALQIAAPQGALTSEDVAAMFSVAVEASISKSSHSLPKPLIVDVGGANKEFERLTGREIPLHEKAWLRATAHERSDMFTPLRCPVPRVLSPACRLVRSGTVVHLLRVRPDSVSGGYELAVNFVHRRAANTDELSGFTALVHVDRVAGQWVAKVRARAVS